MGLPKLFVQRLGHERVNYINFKYIYNLIESHNIMYNIINIRQSNQIS